MEKVQSETWVGAMTPEPCCEFSTGVCRIDKEYEMTFEKWWSDHKYHIGLTSMVDCKAAYLAGQASAEQRVKDLEIQRDEWKHLVKEVDKQLRTEIGALQAKCAELTRERDGWVEYADRRNTAAIVAESQLVTLKAQAGEPVAWQHRQRGLKEYEWQEWQTVGYKPQGPESQTFQMRPLFTHPTTERPYNPLNDYAVIPMPTTERRVIPEDVLSWIDGVLPVVEIFGTTPSQKQWSRDRTREARAWLNAAPAPTKESK